MPKEMTKIEKTTGGAVSRARLIVVLVLAVVGGGSSGALAHSNPAAALATQNVEVVDFDYRPGSVRIAPGDTVNWTFSGEQPHTVTADDGSFDSGEMTTGDFSMRFDEVGTYRYYCALHGGPGGEGMSALVVVEGSGDGEQAPSVDGDGDEAAEGASGNGGNDKADAKNKNRKGGEELPFTGNAIPPVWVFALSLLFSGLVLWRVARLAGGR